MDTNEKQIALSVLESLRAELMHAQLKDGSPVLDVPDFREYLYEMMGRIRTTALDYGEMGRLHNKHRYACDEHRYRGERHDGPSQT